ncbi:hypothetical protein OK016_20900 [Vibrio chagasii]|nr:hypothetical protein [Vibrio chagasii]
MDTGSFIYTTPIRNLESADLNQFATDMNRFAEAASDFYGRDEKQTMVYTVGSRHRTEGVPPSFCE